MILDPATRPPLDRDRLAGMHPDLVPGIRVEVVQVAGSTNALVGERAREGAADGLVVVAEHQTRGRGRLDRTWESPARSALTFSVLLRPEVPARSWPWIPLLTGYAVGKALRACGYAADVKWPNDVLIGGKKVAGILVERIETDQGPAAVLGVGLNVTLSAEELPVPSATSLALESGDPDPGESPERTDLLLMVLQTLREAYDTWQAGGDLGTTRLAESYAAACVTIGQRVRVELPAGGTLVGAATGVDPGGRLLVQHDGTTTVVSAGDVVHVRAADPR
ncbi:MAG: biotin--[acetyl-CoA-carboxylase] ligase [Nocardioides sp.]|nr:biotin--[acetyl-CoA-carboxylase] ligase [Nocardioides sp.]